MRAAAKHGVSKASNIVNDDEFGFISAMLEDERRKKQQARDMAAQAKIATQVSSDVKLDC